MLNNVIKCDLNDTSVLLMPIYSICMYFVMYMQFYFYFRSENEIAVPIF